MARRTDFTMSTAERRRRRFSDNFKKEKVREVELGISTVLEISRQYEVRHANVYRWIAKFGTMKGKKERIVVESQSDTFQLLELKRKVAELERLVGQKQVEIEFKNRMIEIAEEHYRVDSKKKFASSLSATSGSTGKSTDGA
jgi:transposase